MCTLLLVKGWWQQTVQELHLSITMQQMALCMLWTEWSVLSLKLLPSFLHRITSSLYSYPVSYLTSAIFSSRYSQHCPVTKYIVMLNSFWRNLSLTNSFFRLHSHQYALTSMYYVLLQCCQRLTWFRNWKNLVTLPFLLQLILLLRSWIHLCALDCCEERRVLEVSHLLWHASW